MMRRHSVVSYLRAIIPVGLALLGLAPAGAQVRPSAPTREELTRPRPNPAEQPRPRLTVEGDVPRGHCSLADPQFRDVNFTLDQVVFDGLKGLSPDALRPAYADHVGQQMPVGAICEIRDRANAILNAAGYLAAVEVPQQRIEGGTIHLQVVMAKLVGLNIAGAGRGERRVAAYLDRLTRQEVFNRFEAERALLLAGDLPGYIVRLTLRPAGTVRGEVIGEVTVRHYGVLADFNVQNLGAREAGPWGGMARVQFLGLTGLGDRTSLGFFSTPDFDEQKTLQVAHDFAVGGDGLRLGGQFTYSWAHPDLNSSAIDVRAHTLFATVQADFPFVRQQAKNLRGTIGFDVIDQIVDFNGIGLSRDHLRVPFVRLSYDALGLPSNDPRYSLAAPRWRFGATIEARQGIDGLGASKPCGAGLARCFALGIVPPSRLEADPSAFVLRGSLDGEVRPAPMVGFAVSARGQYSHQPLLAFEEFSAGNYTVGRGYDPGALQGDSGAGVQGELRIGRATAKSATGWGVEGFGFVDHAWTWNRDRLFVVPDAQLTSVGGGIRAAWGDRMRLEALVAVPLDRLPLETRRRDPRFLVTLTTRLLPWSF